ncbi:MAG: glycosyltransferase [Micavibrio aeruginosavorus]|uniref:Glycosyltransferase n=1 Tax=Micavibrio aeruginosavorus TaxID=349221 RepID=A0A2W5FQE9_9BACT|nr:MAG: glycosyltransferase [Micavibrio aeruginosavorus]
MLFSIITVTLNNRSGLARTAGSISRQTHKDFQWIIVDGASTDGTPQDARLYQATVISEPDKGIYDAMNKGLDIAQGSYVIFLNAGDCFAEAETLEKIQAAILQNHPDFIYGDSWELAKEKLNYKTARHHSRICTGMFTHHQAMIYKREIISQLLYDLNYAIAADYDFTIRYLKSAQTCLYLNIPLCIFESGGVSQQNVKIGRKEQFIIRQKSSVVSKLQNIAIYLAQVLNWRVRYFMPALYWKLKKFR